jgi:hypothetical protein
MRYRGSIEFFNENVPKFERHMIGTADGEGKLETGQLVKGRCTPEGS